MSLKITLLDDIKTCMRAKEQNRLNVLRLISAAIKQQEVDERITLDDQQIIAILDKMRKQRQESIQQFEKAGRSDLVTQEQYELSIIGSYLPQQLSDAEIADLITQALADSGATSIQMMGKVMALLKPTLQGRADLAKVSEMVKGILGSKT
jgi:uncharacterized protein